jgi:hypothetical protein
MKKQINDKDRWIDIRPKLNNYDISVDWEEAIGLFEKRVTDFYFEPIRNILKKGGKSGEGFSILTLQCALIEFFAAFKFGKIHNYQKPQKNGLKYEYKSSSECFIDFLLSEEIFENHFFKKDKDGNITPDVPFDTKHFYDRVRCGLMHEGRTKKDWLITAAKKDIVSPTNFIFHDKATGSKSVNRTILQNRLKYYFKENYLTELKSGGAKGATLRRFFARKLDHLYDIDRDTLYDWWLDN